MVSFEKRVRAVVLALLILSALSVNLTELRTTWYTLLSPGLDLVSRHEQRLAPLKAALPERGVVGFVTDAPARAEQARRRFIAGYALAPVVVARGADWPLVVGDFKDPAAARLMTGERLRVREDFGNGLVLFAAEGR
jgi:hypothetical protein